MDSSHWCWSLVFSLTISHYCSGILSSLVCWMCNVIRWHNYCRAGRKPNLLVYTNMDGRQTGQLNKLDINGPKPPRLNSAVHHHQHRLKGSSVLLAQHTEIVYLLWQCYQKQPHLWKIKATQIHFIGVLYEKLYLFPGTRLLCLVFTSWDVILEGIEYWGG